MAKEKVEHRQIEDIMANSVDKKKLLSFIDEAVRVKRRIADENESFKAIKEEAEEQIGCNPKLFQQLVKISVDNSYIETKTNISALESAIEMLFETGE
jgi:hypothetical protein